MFAFKLYFCLGKTFYLLMVQMFLTLPISSTSLYLVILRLFFFFLLKFHFFKYFVVRQLKNWQVIFLYNFITVTFRFGFHFTDDLSEIFSFFSSCRGNLRVRFCNIVMVKSLLNNSF